MPAPVILCSTPISDALFCNLMAAKFLFRPILLVVLASQWIAPSVLAGSNLGITYPDHACGERPIAPERPETFETETAIKSYNAEVGAYNTAAETFVQCIQNYVDNAAEDIKVIRAKAREAVEQADP